MTVADIISLEAFKFGFLAMFTAADNPASSALTRRRLGWTPAHAGLLEDLDEGHYFA